MAYDRARAQATLVRLAKAAPGRMRGPVGRATRRFRGGFDGPLVSVVLAVSDDETTRIGPCLDTLRAQSYRNLDILVVPYGRHDKVLEIARRHAVDDWRVRIRRGTESTLAAARNAGVEATRADLLLVVSGGDDLVPQGITRLVDAHIETGSPVVVGRMREPETVGWVPDSPYDAAHRVYLARTTLEETPVAITDLGLGNKLFTRSLWRRAAVRFTPGSTSGTDVAIRLLHKAETFTLLKEFTYVPTGRRDGIGVGSMPDVLSGLEAWIDRHERTWKAVDALRLPDVRDWWLWGVLDTAVQPLVADVERADDRQWTRLRDHVSMLLDAADAALWSSLSAESRVKLWLLQHDHRAQLEEFAASRLFAQGNRPTVVRDGRVWAQLPFHDDEALGVPAELYEMTESETRLRAMLREVRWVGSGQIALTIFAAIDFVHLSAAPAIDCVLIDHTTGDRIELTVALHRDVRANQRGRRHQDFSWGAFVATVPVADLVAASTAKGLPDAGRTWTIEVTMSVDGVTRSGPITDVDEQGSAGFIGESHLAPRPVDGVLVGFSPRSTVAGLRVRPDRGPRLLALDVDGRAVSGVIDPAGVPVVAVRASMGSLQARGEVTATDRGLAFRLMLPSPWAGQQLWRVQAVTEDGRAHGVGWPDLPDQWLGVGQGALVGARDGAGRTTIQEATQLIAVDEVRVEELVVTITGRWLAGEAPSDARIELVGSRVDVEGELASDGPAGEVRATFRLLADPWELGERPVPNGMYWLAVSAGGRSVRAVLGEQAVDQLHHFMLGRHYTARVVRLGRDCGVELTRPLGDDERGPYAREQLQEWYRHGDIPLDETAVYLQSYVGASATDSQLAIHEELRRTRPDLTIHWGVTGSSSWVPEGGVPVVINTREWYRVLASAKYLCLNIDPERWFERRPGQRVLQTFHGYPAKSMGLRMWRAKHYTPKRIELELARTSGEWDLILTPAPEMDEHYRREYAYDGPILNQGYPRDDVLVSDGADAIRDDTRRRLGIRPGQKAVLYAPTWRDDLATNWRSAEMVQHLDLEAASRALGPDYVLLMRGHRFHAGVTSPATASGARFLDVTDYPEINDLILAADAAVLDYSSLRFDFALTGRPMIFLVPDLDTYVGGVRGFLYDFRSSAPGPLVDTAEEAVRLLRDFGGLERACAPQLARFNQDFNHLQDGRSAERSVAAFFGDGPVATKELT